MVNWPLATTVNTVDGQLGTYLAIVANGLPTQTVTFEVIGYSIPQTATWQSGLIARLGLYGVTPSTPAATHTATASPTPTATATATRTATASPTAINTATRTTTNTPTASSTATASPSATATATLRSTCPHCLHNNNTVK